MNRLVWVSGSRHRREQVLSARCLSIYYSWHVDAVDAVDTVDTVDTVDAVDAVDTLDKLDTVDAVDTVYTVDTVVRVMPTNYVKMYF